MCGQPPMDTLSVAQWGGVRGGAGGEEEVVNKAFVSEGQWEVEVAGYRYPALVSLSPMYDPTNARIKM